ncbi:hypothetical protein ETAA8_14320 [Anatilimnocola aggregata]|uniref:Methyltransferase type 12 n=1 Tax=Anatilimnocola aggregata TaxID=2528021 RepID=A0A517Y7Y4_9BACT|nr:methyltransferase domain-containing protein [Anatilimnocola aggregata]QDU26354.1 hypothetical protein ETAA8_14320 [Anatilimnocola aggregata]
MTTIYTVAPASNEPYVGTELELFSRAVNWKAYVHRQIAPYLGSRVLEVGAGIGTTTLAQCRKPHTAWLCLEPDRGQVAQIDGLIERRELPACCTTFAGFIADLPASELYDSILYMDVLEHIEHDAAEAARAAEHLLPGGYLIALCPAHQSLYSPFDRAIGHYRRYSRRSLAAAIPSSLQRVSLRYLDSVGLCASFANRLLLKQSMPTPRQIAVWDSYFVRTSRWLDPLLCYSLGKSVLGIWQKPA